MAKNQKNKSISADELKGLNESQIEQLLSKKGNYIQFIENPTRKQCLIAVKQNGYAIRYIKCQFPELADIAIAQQASAIQFVSAPTPEQLSIAFDKDPNVIAYIKNPTYEQQLNAVSRKGGTIQYIDNPSNELLEIAIENEPMALGYIFKKVPKEQLKYWIKKATKKKPQAIKTIINSVNKNMQIEFLSLYGFGLRYINKQTEELCITAVKNNPLAIQFVHEQTQAIQKIVIDSRNSAAIDMLDNLDRSIEAHLVSLKPKKIERIKNPSPEIVKAYNQAIIQEDKKARRTQVETGITPNDELVYQEKLRQRVMHIENNHDFCIEIVDNTFPVYKTINILSEIIDPISADIATGFLFESGLGMLKPTFNTLFNKGVQTTLTIGSLQNYFDVLKKHELITEMDFRTATLLNKYIKSNLIKLKTYDKSFYHGKYYYFQGKEVSFILLGSSNVSASGLSGNRELNTLYIFHNSSDIMKCSIEWYRSFVEECTNIDLLSEFCFIDKSNTRSTIAYEVSNRAMQMQVAELSDKERQERLNLWLSKSPTTIYKLKDGCTKAFDNYVLIQYENYNLCVLESFNSGNAFYCFNTGKFSDIEKDLVRKTKVQLFSHPLLIKRGYHSSDMFNLMLNVNSLF